MRKRRVTGKIPVKFQQSKTLKIPNQSKIDEDVTAKFTPQRDAESEADPIQELIDKEEMLNVLEAS